MKVTLYCDELADKIFGYGYRTDQIFHVDENSLIYKALPDKT